MAYDTSAIATAGKREQRHERAHYTNSQSSPERARGNVPPARCRPPQWRPDLIESVDFAGCSSVGRSAFSFQAKAATMCGVGSRRLGRHEATEEQLEAEAGSSAGKSGVDRPELASPSFLPQIPRRALWGFWAHRSSREAAEGRFKHTAPISATRR